MPDKLIKTITFWFEDDPDGAKMAKFKKYQEEMFHDFFEQLNCCTDLAYEYECTEVTVKEPIPSDTGKPWFCLRYRDKYLSKDYGPTTNPSEILFFDNVAMAEKCDLALTDSAHCYTQVRKNFGNDVNFNEFKVVQYAGHGSDQKVPS